MKKANLLATISAASLGLLAGGLVGGLVGVLIGCSTAYIVIGASVDDFFDWYAYVLGVPVIAAIVGSIIGVLIVVRLAPDRL